MTDEEKAAAKAKAEAEAKAKSDADAAEAKKRDEEKAAAKAKAARKPYHVAPGGNLYFDKQWWSVSLDHYRAAIRKNQGYRRNAVLNRNVIRMLASTKTRQTATNFLRGVIGSFSRPYLKWAATNEKNPVVRKQAATLSRYIR